MSKPAFREYAPGTAIDHGDRTYVVEERISHGKFGTVFACRDDWGQKRILRVVRPFSRNYESVREKWPGQVTELQGFQHPGLVYVQAGFEHEGAFHLVLERCDYRLDRFLNSPAWDGARWFRAVARPVLCALEHLHRSGYTHQNLHPHNVFCTLHLDNLHPDSLFSGALKLGDLDVNVLLGRVEVLNTKIPRWLVPPEYLSPSDFGPLDHRVDVYQAGLLLLAILQGRITHFTFEDISAGLPARTAEKLESGYGPIVARALHVNVADRFQGARELWQALSAEPIYR